MPVNFLGGAFGRPQPWQAHGQSREMPSFATQPWQPPPMGQPAQQPRPWQPPPMGQPAAPWQPPSFGTPRPPWQPPMGQPATPRPPWQPQQPVMSHVDPRPQQPLTTQPMPSQPLTTQPMPEMSTPTPLPGPPPRGPLEGGTFGIPTLQPPGDPNQPVMSHGDPVLSDPNENERWAMLRRGVQAHGGWGKLD